MNLLRYIRQRLLAQGKTTKYLLYAIGEIFLVVIGILIALQINNWNEEKINANIELALLKSCREGLEKDLSDVLYNMDRHMRGIESANYVIDKLESKSSYNLDSIAFKMSEAVFPTLFVHSTSAFEAIKSKGVNIISNVDLRNHIIDVYDSRYNFFLRFEEDFLDEIDHGYQDIFPTRFEEGYKYNIDESFSGELKPLDFDQLRSDQEFKYYLKTLRNETMLLVNFQYQQLYEDIESLMKELDAEIKSKENL